jgi:hypothetical protein
MTGNKLVILCGSVGSGKTMDALFLANTWKEPTQIILPAFIIEGHAQKYEDIIKQKYYSCNKIENYQQLIDVDWTIKIKNPFKFNIFNAICGKALRLPSNIIIDNCNIRCEDLLFFANFYLSNIQLFNICEIVVYLVPIIENGEEKTIVSMETIKHISQCYVSTRDPETGICNLLPFCDKRGKRKAKMDAIGVVGSIVGRQFNNNNIDKFIEYINENMHDKEPNIRINTVLGLPPQKLDSVYGSYSPEYWQEKLVSMTDRLNAKVRDLVTPKFSCQIRATNGIYQIKN